MMRQRFFAPGFVAAVGPYFVAIDKVQPVAVVVSRHGDLVHVESWADRVAVPSVSPWPNRRFGISPNGVLVQDLPDGDVVSLTIGEPVIAEVVPSSAFGDDEIVVRYPRLFSVRLVDLVAAGEGWRFHSRLHRFQLSVEVAFHNGGSVSTLHLPRASIVSCATLGRVGAICVRRANKRPWEFDPSFELHIVEAGSSGTLKGVQLAAHDISDLCWSPKIGGPDLVQLVRDYADHAIDGCRIVAERGARDVRLELRRLESDPELELSFELPGFPGVRFIRVDKPVNELGHLAGLRALNISLDEDLEGGDLLEVLLADVGPVEGRLRF